MLRPGEEIKEELEKLEKTDLELEVYCYFLKYSI